MRNNHVIRPTVTNTKRQIRVKYTYVSIHITLITCSLFPRFSFVASVIVQVGVFRRISELLSWIFRKEFGVAVTKLKDDFIITANSRCIHWKIRIAMKRKLLVYLWLLIQMLENLAQMFIVLFVCNVSSTNYRHTDEYTFDRLHDSPISRGYWYSPTVWPPNTGIHACIAASILQRKSFPLNWSLHTPLPSFHPFTSTFAMMKSSAPRNP